MDELKNKRRVNMEEMNGGIKMKDMNINQMIEKVNNLKSYEIYDGDDRLDTISYIDVMRILKGTYVDEYEINDDSEYIKMVSDEQKILSN